MIKVEFCLNFNNVKVLLNHLQASHTEQRARERAVPLHNR